MQRLEKINLKGVGELCISLSLSVKIVKQY